MAPSVREGSLDKSLGRASEDPATSASDRSGPAWSAALAKARSSGGIEILSAMVLASAGLMTSWAGFQGQLWTGVQTSNYAECTVLRLEASRMRTRADQRQAVEVSLFSAWMDAHLSGKQRLAAIYRERLPEDFKPAFETWLAARPLQTTGAPLSPFDMPGYRRADEAIEDMDAKAETLFETAERASRTAANFGQANAMLATAMFFAGISQVFQSNRLRSVLLMVAGVAVLAGAVRVFTLPMIHPSWQLFS